MPDIAVVEIRAEVKPNSAEWSIYVKRNAIACGMHRVSPNDLPDEVRNTLIRWLCGEESESEHGH